jgi:hypothetical protein
VASNRISRRAFAPVHIRTNRRRALASVAEQLAVWALAPVLNRSGRTGTGANALRLMSAVILEEMESLDAEAAEVLETIRGLV